MLALAALAGGSASAQSSPGGFQLPTPTPTPTPVPQGPVDERAGVPIAPRIIPERSTTPAPTPTPTPAPIETATPPPAIASEAPTTETTPAPSATQTPSGTTPSPVASPQGSGQVRPPQSTAQPAVQPSAPTGEVGQGPSPLAEPESSIGPDDWYNVNELGTENESNAADPGLGSDLTSGPAGSAWDDAQEAFTQTRTLAFSGVMAVLVLLGLGWLWWRRRTAREPLALEGPALAAGVRRSLAATQSTRTQPEPAPPPAPLDIDLSLEILSASRSVMMFTLEYRLTIANRSERAARDIDLVATLSCAQRGRDNAAPLASGQPLDTIDRIGPHQSRSVTGQLQMPLTEVQAIRQGQSPIFIPLLHVSLVSDGDQSLTRSFVVGEPSTASQGRVHPIRLDTPPGGIPGLRAREVNLETA